MQEPIVSGLNVSDVPKPRYKGMQRHHCSTCNRELWLINRKDPQGSLSIAKICYPGKKPTIVCHRCVSAMLQSEKRGKVIHVDATSEDAGVLMALIASGAMPEAN